MFTVKLWDVRTGKFLRIMRGTSRQHIPVGFLSGNKKLLVQHGHTVNIWDLKQPSLIGKWRKPDGVLALNRIKASPSEDRVIAISDGSINVYQIPEKVFRR